MNESINQPPPTHPPTHAPTLLSLSLLTMGGESQKLPNIHVGQTTEHLERQKAGSTCLPHWTHDENFDADATPLSLLPCQDHSISSPICPSATTPSSLYPIDIAAESTLSGKTTPPTSALCCESTQRRLRCQCQFLVRCTH